MAERALDAQMAKMKAAHGTVVVLPRSAISSRRRCETSMTRHASVGSRLAAGST